MAKTTKVTRIEDEKQVPALVISTRKAVEVQGNYEEIREYLKRVRDEYLTIDFARASIEDVKRIKEEMRTYRRSVERIEKDTKAKFFNDPKKVFEGQTSSILTLISEVESRVDEQLDALDQVRIDGINLSIDTVIAKLQKEAELPPECLERIVRQKRYYNVTAKEAETLADVTAQFEELKREWEGYVAAKALITKKCEKDERLNLSVYIELLDRGDHVATILERIEEELERLNGIITEVEAEEVVEEEEADIASDVASLDLSSDLPERTKVATVEITYPADCANQLTELFALLRKKGIFARIIG